MAKKDFDQFKYEKSSLGFLINELRRNKKESLRSFAVKIGLPASNLSFIEKGKNAPSPEVYSKILKELKPDKINKHKMDTLYSLIRNMPPPDICDFILKNANIYELFDEIQNYDLNSEKIIKIREIIKSS